MPRALDKGGSDDSFESLCRRFASDVPATTLLKELLHVNAVEERGDGKLVAKTRYFMPLHVDPGMILSSGSVLQDLGNTVAHNLYRGDEGRPMFERRATNTRVARSAIPQFQQYLEKEGQAFLERVDAWLTEHEVPEGSEDESVRLGLGAYWIEN